MLVLRLKFLFTSLFFPSLHLDTLALLVFKLLKGTCTINLSSPKSPSWPLLLISSCCCDFLLSSVSVCQFPTSRSHDHTSPPLSCTSSIFPLLFTNQYICNPFITTSHFTLYKHACPCSSCCLCCQCCPCWPPLWQPRVSPQALNERSC